MPANSGYQLIRAFFTIFCYLCFLSYLRKGLILLLAYDVNVNRMTVSTDHSKEQLTLQPSY